MVTDKDLDINLVVLAGTLTSDAEIRTFESGATLARILVTVKTEEPRRRLDVIPVVIWNPDIDESVEWTRGKPVWVAGAVQRRFWSVSDGRESRVEIVAHEITIREEVDV